MRKGKTTIQITTKLRSILSSMGLKQDTWEDIIKKIVDDNKRMKKEILELKKRLKGYLKGY